MPQCQNHDDTMRRIFEEIRVMSSGQIKFQALMEQKVERIETTTESIRSTVQSIDYSVNDEKGKIPLKNKEFESDISSTKNELALDISSIKTDFRVSKRFFMASIVLIVSTVGGLGIALVAILK